MGCPQCQSDDISDSGICFACGYVTSISGTAQESESESEIEKKESASETENSESQNHSGLIEVDYSEGEPVKEQAEEKPAWRQELAQRLHEIKQKRESMGLAEQFQARDKKTSMPTQRTQANHPSISSAARTFESAPVRKPVQKLQSPLPKQKTLQPLSTELSGGKPAPSETAARDVQALIDNAISGRSSQSPGTDATGGFSNPSMELPSDDEGKLILLSRTLSGLVDLIIVLLCSGVCIIAADFFSGIIALDTVSYLIYSVLFLLTYFFYSIFFLTASSQTIGMMITDLRVVDAEGGRPSISQLLRRGFGHLASLLVLGLGLLWSLFDRESQCFHDRISDTRVIRLN
jgi:uncharacterized RDD family membrane protein YckC